MDHFNKTRLALALAGALGLAGTAHANALATSIMEITALTFNDHVAGAGGGPILTHGVHISVIGYSQNASADAQLDATSLGVSVPASVAPIDIPVQCVGAPCPAANAFPVVTAPPGSTFAAADQIEVGSPVAGVDPRGPAPVLSTPATVKAGSWGSLIGAHTADANANNGLVAQTTFIATTGGIIDLIFDVDAYLEAFTTPGGIGEFAQASYDISFELRNNSRGNVVVFRWTPDGLAGGIVGGTEVLDPFSLSDTVAASDPFGGVNLPIGQAKGVKQSGSFEAETPVLVAGNTYTLNMKMGTRIDAAALPEPGVLALLGIGLMGLAGLRRRAAR